MIINAELMFKAKSEVSKADSLIKMIEATGLNYQDHGKAILCDLKDFRGQFIILMTVIQYRFNTDDSFNDKNKIENYFKNLEAEFKSEIKLIKRKKGMPNKWIDIPFLIRWLLDVNLKH